MLVILQVLGIYSLNAQEGKVLLFDNLIEVENLLHEYTVFEDIKDREEFYSKIKQLYSKIPDLDKISDEQKIYIDIVKLFYTALIEDADEKALNLSENLLKNYKNIKPKLKFKILLVTMTQGEFKHLDRSFADDFIELTARLSEQVNASTLEKDFIKLNKAALFTNYNEFDKAIQEWEKIHSPFYRGLKIESLLVLSASLNKFDEAIKIYKKAIIDTSLTNYKNRYSAFMALSLLNNDQSQLVIDLFSKEAEEIQDSDQGGCSLKFIVALAHRYNEDYDTALKHFTKIMSSEFFQETNSICYITSINGILDCYSNLGEYIKFDALLSKHDSLFSSLSENSIITLAHKIVIANNKLKQKKYLEAYEYYTEVKKKSDSLNIHISKNKKKQLLSGLAQSSLKLGLIEESDKFFKELTTHLQNGYKLKSEVNEFSINALKVKYENKILEEKTKLDAIKIDLLQEEVITQRYKLFMSIGVLFIGLVFGLWYLSYKARKKLEKAYNLLAIEKTEVSKLVDEREKLLAHVTHQSKTPLVNMNYMVDIIDKVESSNDRSQLKNHLKKMLEIVNVQMEDILNWIKAVLDSNINIEKVDLYQIVESIIKENIVLLESKSLTIVNKINSKTMVNTNQEAIKIILNNLLINAAKYSYLNNRIIFELIDNSLIVTDYGEGMSVSMKESIISKTNPVKSNHPQDDSLISGTGLGLYLVKDLCEKLKLKLDIISNIGKGTVIKVSFE